MGNSRIINILGGILILIALTVIMTFANIDKFYYQMDLFVDSNLSINTMTNLMIQNMSQSMQHTFEDAVNEISNTNYSQLINETFFNKFYMIDIDFLLKVFSNKTILLFGDSLLKFQFTYIISVLFYCTNIYTNYNISSLPESLYSCPEFCNRYKYKNTTLIFTKCEIDIFYQYHSVIGFANKILKHQYIDKYYVYHINEFNITLINIDRWASNLAKGQTEKYKLSSFQFELIHFNEIMHIQYDIMITNMVGMHINTIRSGRFEQPMSFYMHRYMEYAIKDFINDEHKLHPNTKCIIVGTINSLCYEGFFGRDLPLIKDWMRIQSKIYLFQYFYTKLLHEINEKKICVDCNDFDFEEWIMINISSIHSQPMILSYIPKQLDFDSFSFFMQGINNFSNKHITRLFELTPAQQEMLDKCSKLLPNYKVYRNISFSYRQNTCMLYARTPLSTNFIAQRFRDTVVNDMNKEFSNVYYYDQHKLMRNYQHLCDVDWFVAVHFPPLYYIEWMTYINIIYHGC